MYCRDELSHTRFAHWLSTPELLTELVSGCSEHQDCSGDQITGIYGHGVDFRFQCESVTHEVPVWLLEQVNSFKWNKSAMLTLDDTSNDTCDATETISGHYCTCYLGFGWTGSTCSSVLTWGYVVTLVRCIAILVMVICLFATILIYTTIRDGQRGHQWISKRKAVEKHRQLVLIISVLMIIVNIAYHIETVYFGLDPQGFLESIPPFWTFLKIAIAYISFASLNLIEVLHLLETLPTTSDNNTVSMVSSSFQANSSFTSSFTLRQHERSSRFKNRVNGLAYVVRIVKIAVRITIVLLVCAVCTTVATQGHDSIGAVFGVLLPFLVMIEIGFATGSILLAREARKFIPATKGSDTKHDRLSAMLNLVRTSIKSMNRVVTLALFMLLLRVVVGPIYPQFNQLEFIGASVCCCSLPVVIVVSWKRALLLKLGDRSSTRPTSRHGNNFVMVAPVEEESSCGTILVEDSVIVS